MKKFSYTVAQKNNCDIVETNFARYERDQKSPNKFCPTFLILISVTDRHHRDHASCPMSLDE